MQVEIPNKVAYFDKLGFSYHHIKNVASLFDFETSDDIAKNLEHTDTIFLFDEQHITLSTIGFYRSYSYRPRTEKDEPFVLSKKYKFAKFFMRYIDEKISSSEERTKVLKILTTVPNFCMFVMMKDEKKLSENLDILEILNKKKHDFCKVFQNVRIYLIPQSAISYSFVTDDYKAIEFFIEKNYRMIYRCSGQRYTLIDLINYKDIKDFEKLLSYISEKDRTVDKRLSLLY